MATKVQYLDLAGLTKYDELIKQYIGNEDAKSYKVVKISGQKLQFFKSATPAADATPDTEITLPQQDISNFIEKVTNATVGNIATLNADGTITDSGKKPSDFIERHQDITGKADKVTGAINGNFAALDNNGNLTDSGHKHSDYLTAHQDISGKADKDTSATTGNIAKFDANGNPVDAGIAATTVLTQHQDITGKADKVENATNGNFAGLDANGNLTDSGKKASDFALDSKVGDLDDLNTTEKGNLVGALNEVKGDVDSLETSSAVTLEEAVTTTSGYAKTYVVKQGGNQIGKIDIPKDMVVSSGTVETKTTSGGWGKAGTYIVLTIANATNDTLYIPATSLVDVYTAQNNAAQVQLTVTGHEISAEIVDGSVDADALATDAVTTAKIAAKNVTKAKLSDEVQTSLGLADTALQWSNFETITEAQINALFA